VRDPELTHGHAEAIAAWAAGLRGQIPALTAALQSTLDAMRAEVGDEGLGRAAAAHPAGGALLRLAAGKLSLSHLGCAGPQDVIRLAGQVGVDTAPAP
jgi:hypothetical protein